MELALHWWFNPELQPEFFHGPKFDDGHPLREPNELNIAVIQAQGLQGLKSTLGGNSADPVISVVCGSEKTQRTGVKRKQLDPVWNETFKISVEAAPTSSGASRSALSSSMASPGKRSVRTVLISSTVSLSGVSIARCDRKWVSEARRS